MPLTYLLKKSHYYFLMYFIGIKHAVVISLTGMFMLISHQIFAQQTEKKLLFNVESSTTDSGKISSLGDLAAYYYENFDDKRGDSLLQRQLLVAEACRNQALILKVLFNNTANKIYDLKNNKRFKKDRSLLQRALEFAKNNELNDYVSLAYCCFSVYELDDGNMEKGLNFANLAITTSFSSTNDSVKALCALQVGNAYLMQGNALMAFKAYNNAYDLAVKKGNKILVAEVYRAISGMYKILGQSAIAIDYIFRSIEVFQQAGFMNEVAADYIALGKLYSYDIAKDYLIKAEKLADSLNNRGLKLAAQKILFSYIMTKEKPAVSMQYLQQHTDLLKLHAYKGEHYTDWMYGEIFLYGAMPDSARFYFDRAAPFFDSGYNITQQKDFYYEMANSYFESTNADINKTIYYKEKSLKLSKQVSSLREIKTISYDLSMLYQRKRNLEKALFYNRQYDLYKDSLNLFSKEKDLAILEIGNETKRKNEAEIYAQKKMDRLHNLQYMVITISVLTAFVLLLFLGLFKLSKLTIQVMGFLSFISFFEFIIMLLDHYIHDITHGEPLKIWLIKIGLLSFLLPLHHYLEEKFIHYLVSKKLIKLKSFHYLKEFVVNVKKKTFFSKAEKQPVAVKENEIFVP